MYLRRAYRKILDIGAVCASLLVSVGSTVAVGPPPITIRRATIIAFCPITGAELKAHPEASELLTDFDTYSNEVTEPLRSAGIDLRRVYTDSFRTQSAGVITTFKPDAGKEGYYLVAPGKQPKVRYGILVAGDILALARKYFGIAIR